MGIYSATRNEWQRNGAIWRGTGYDEQPHGINCRSSGATAIEALKKPCRVELYTDSVYVGKGISEWMPKWKKRAWKRDGKLVKNVELWQRLDELIENHKIAYHRVAGHSGHPENERCDELAVLAYQRYL